ncbi:helix-turn-helix domain-containing protein [Bradyrhizobium sp. 5.13L]
MNGSTAADNPGRGPEALAHLRAMTVDICEVIPRTAEDEFHVTTVTRMTRNALLIDTRATDQDYDRTPAHVARGVMDHFQITLCVEGEMRFSSGRREVTLRPGDIVLIDMAQPNRTALLGAGGRTHLMTIVLQRAMLAPRLAHPDAATATLLLSDNPHARLLASHYGALALPSETDTATGHAEATVEAIADLVAAAAGGTAEIVAGLERAERHLYLTMIKRRIANNLETEALTSEELCRHFHISRATLYRLFEAEGGLAQYVREQRLNLAFRRLISPSAQDGRLIELAVDMRFSSDSTFIRAFRRKFGLPPGELRALAETWLRETGAVPAVDTVLHQLARRRGSQR